MPSSSRLASAATRSSLTSLERIEPTFFYSNRREPGNQTLILRGDPTAARAGIEVIARAVEPRSQVQVTTLRQTIRAALAQSFGSATIAWGISAIALALVLTGTFGVFAYVVEERRREIGLRLALGATRRQVVGAVLRAIRGSIASGILAGVVVALAANQLLRAALYGLSPLDPLTYLVVVAILGVVATAAALIPARRAARVDPVIALRSE